MNDERLVEVGGKALQPYAWDDLTDSERQYLDRDATKEALADVDVFGVDSSNMIPLIQAARWALAVTEGDGIWWCERHQRRWGYTWSPRGASVSEVAAAPDRVGDEMRVVEIVTECEHGKTDPHRWEPSTTISDEGWCPGGSRRVLEPGSFVLVKKVDGRWPMTNRVFNAIEDALVRETGSASMRTIETVVETYLDALAEGEQ